MPREAPPELRMFLEAYDRKIGRLFFATRRAVLAAAPDATELIYDAYSALTIAYSFTDRLRHAFCHVAAYRDHVNLGFNNGVALNDPDRLLAGTGVRIRHIRIGAEGDLRRPGVQRLLRAAVEQGRRAGPSALPAKPQSIVKAVYPKKRRPLLTNRPV
jgi:hypothetical protein